LNAELGYRQKFYALTNASGTENEGSADLHGRLSGRLIRAFGTGAHRWLHQIEPEMNYQHIAESHPDQEIDFDRYDQIDAVHTLGYALVNRLSEQWRDTEGQQQRREVLWLKLSQDYQLEDVAEDASRFSLLRIELQFRPAEHKRLDLDSYYDFSQHRLTYLSVAGRLDDGRGNLLSLDYVKQRSVDGGTALSNLNFHTETSLLKPLYLSYDQRYDLQESNLLEGILGVELREQCWGVKVSYTKRQDDEAFLLTLNLSGLGNVGSYHRGSEAL